MKAFALAAALCLATASAATPKLRASHQEDHPHDPNHPPSKWGHPHKAAETNCVQPGWRNCFMEGENEDGKECCGGAECKFIPGGNSRVANNGLHYVCVIEEEAEAEE